MRRLRRNLGDDAGVEHLSEGGTTPEGAPTSTMEQ